jgi:hypothetical protein
MHEVAVVVSVVLFDFGLHENLRLYARVVQQTSYHIFGRGVASQHLDGITIFFELFACLQKMALCSISSSYMLPISSDLIVVLVPSSFWTQQLHKQHPIINVLLLKDSKMSHEGVYFFVVLYVSIYLPFLIFMYGVRTKMTTICVKISLD